MVIWRQQNEINHSIYAPIRSRAGNPSIRKLNGETSTPSNPTIEHFNGISAVKDEYTRPFWVGFPLFKQPLKGGQRREPATLDATFSVLVRRFLPRWGEKSRAEKMGCYPEDLRFDGDEHVEGRRGAAGSVFLEEHRL